METTLKLNGASQIVQRLNYLAREEIGSWKWKHSLVGLVLVGTLFLATPGWEPTRIIAADVKQPPDRQFKDAVVEVVDEDGNPIEGATIQPDGMRVKGGHAADAYHWIPSLFGPPPRGTTDREGGKLTLRYPVAAFPEHGELTGELIFNVVHREFSTLRIQ